jgi:hypothetical protein
MTPGNMRHLGVQKLIIFSTEADHGTAWRRGCCNLGGVDAAAVDLWYAREHLLERIQIPGFLRARRYVRALGSADNFMIYELRDTDALTSPEYLERLNNPTPRTKQVMATALALNRTLCRVVARMVSASGRIC